MTVLLAYTVIDEARNVAVNGCVCREDVRAVEVEIEQKRETFGAVLNLPLPGFLLSDDLKS